MKTSSVLKGREEMLFEEYHWMHDGGATPMTVRFCVSVRTLNAWDWVCPYGMDGLVLVG